MAVQPIIGKRIVRIDKKHPNYNPNIEETVDDENIYGDNVYQAPIERNGNLKLEEMMSKMMGKLDNIKGGKKNKQMEAVEVDIQREIAIGMVDQNAVKSEEIKGKVKTNKNKLKALRKRNGR